MGPLSYMQSIVDRNVIMQHMTVYSVTWYLNFLVRRWYSCQQNIAQVRPTAALSLWSLVGRSEEGVWHPVCGDGWNVSWSDVACQSLGYSKATFTEYPSVGDSVNEYYSLRPGIASPLAGATSRLSSALRRSDNESACTSGTVVEVACQEFSKFSKADTFVPTYSIKVLWFQINSYTNKVLLLPGYS